MKSKLFSVALRSAFFLAFFSAKSLVFGQQEGSQSLLFPSLAPAFDHYERLAAISPASKNAARDTQVFPLAEFRRQPYLKLRTVYLEVPVATFRLRDFPANSSAQTEAEVAFLMDLQARKTARDIALTDSLADVYHDPFTFNPTNADYPRNIKSLFFVGRNLGEWFNPTACPTTSEVLQNVIQDATFYFFSLKSEYARPRPYQLTTAIRMPESLGHASFPSGHSSASYIHAFLLSEIFPERREAFLTNAFDMAFSREIRGVHYPSDSRMGRDFAEKFVGLLLKNKAFKADFKKMRAELKAASNSKK